MGYSNEHCLVTRHESEKPCNIAVHFTLGVSHASPPSWYAAMKSNLVRYVHGQVLGKSFVISAHLWLEYLLVRSLYAKLPNPDALLQSRNLGFHMLVSLNEALAIIEPKLAEALRLLNTMRNKCAHHHSKYEPSDSEFKLIRSALETLGGDFSPYEKDEWGSSLEVLAALLEIRARAVGAADIEAILPDEQAF